MLLRTALALLLCASQTSCTSGGISGHAGRDWLTYQSVGGLLDPKVPRSHFAPVTPAKRPEAINLLRNEQIVSLDAATVADFAPDLSRDAQNSTRRFFLVRGVKVIGAAGDFTLYEADKYLRVYFGGMASRYAPEVRWPLVVALERKPKKVFIELSVDE